MSIMVSKRTVTALTVAVIAACAVLLSLALHRLMQAEKDLANSVGENVLWLISQVHYEDHRLALAGEAWNRGNRNEDDVDQLQLRLDMALSRLALLSEGMLGEVIARNLGSVPLQTATTHLKSFEQALKTATTSKSPIPRTVLDNLLSDAAMFSNAANDIMIAERNSGAAERDRYRAVLFEASIAVLLIFGFGIFIVMRLVASLRSVALAERALRRDRDFSRLLLESSGDGVAAFDQDLRCTHWNTSMSAMFPIPGGGNIVGQHIQSAYSFADDHTVMKLMRQTLAGQSLHVPAHAIPSGTRYIEKFTYPIRSGDVIVGGILFFRDVTDAHGVQLELVKHRDQLESLVAERTRDLEESLARETGLRELYKGFVSMVSHQFRTPLSIIDASAQRIIRRGKHMTEGEIHERAGKIRAAVLRLTRLVSSTLNAAKVDAGQIDVDIRRCDLAKLIVEACERQKEASPNRTFRIELEQLPAWTPCDALLIDQVIANLLSNAVKYSSPPHPIDIVAEVDHLRVRVRVSDRGVGIPDEERDRLFERFFRAQTAVGVEGTGIGLHVARSIARMHGGDVDAFAREGGGSTFVLTIPREEVLAA
ncbi:signal transduction histidine kinase [Mycoplana sp. BE70]|uniref:sensor histidine kinase n=1 Tax=Mycoplana sp. BE70 TaxID=2817775 RepID=UPI00285B84AF|nr:ATP-binding protein [Mycoplana sp. BE70]MDR6759242.1 signal transduction histidine kinase [Mycoplana sp. BE70]